MEKSYKINYNIKDIKTWKNESATGKIFYSLTFPEQLGKDKFEGKNVRVSFTTAEKFVFENTFGVSGDRTLYIVPTFDYTISGWDIDNKISLTEKDKIIVNGSKIVELIRKYVPKAKVQLTEYKPKEKEVEPELTKTPKEF